MEVPKLCKMNPFYLDKSVAFVYFVLIKGAHLTCYFRVRFQITHLKMVSSLAEYDAATSSFPGYVGVLFHLSFLVPFLRLFQFVPLPRGEEFCV